MRRALSGAFAVLCLAWPVLAAPAPAWWHRAWEQRVTFGLPVVVVAGKYPVTVPCRALLAAGVPEQTSVDSLRVIGPAGDELAAQVEERDGTGEIQACGNGTLDDDDELVFVAALPAGAAVSCQVYFSRQPRPPGRYPCALRYGRPSGAFREFPAHGTFYGKDLKVSVKGPKLADPLTNLCLNHCSGAVSELRWKGFDFVRPGHSWSWYIPNHPFGGGPSAVAWSLPALVVDGPVRKVVVLEATGLPAPVRRVRHSVAVYADVPVVDFEQIVQYEASQPKAEIALGFPLAVPPDFRAAGGTPDCMKVTDLDAAQRDRAAKGTAMPLLQNAKAPDALPWWGWCSPAERVGLAVFWGRGGTAAAPDWQASAYTRSQQCHLQVQFRFRDAATVRHGLRLLCGDDLESLPDQFRLWSWPAAGADIAVGTVETVGKTP